MKNDTTTRMRKIIGAIDKKTVIVFYVFVLTGGACAIGGKVLGGAIAMATGITTFEHLAVGGSTFIIAIGMLSMVVKALVTFALDVIELIDGKITLRSAISAFIAMTAITLLAMGTTCVAVWWGVKYLAKNL